MNSKSKSAVFARNVKAFAQYKNIMMKDIERNAGLSSGYMSRVAKTGSIPLDTALTISSVISQDLMELIQENYMDKFEIYRLSVKVQQLRELLAEEEGKLRRLKGDNEIILKPSEGEGRRTGWMT